MEQFQIIFEGKEVPVQIMRTGTVVLYIVTFTDRKTLAVTRGKKFEEGFFWTSVPEGRQAEAEKIGPMIDKYLQSKQKAHVLL